MLVWIVILFLWASLMLVILHDATKGELGGSAVVLAAGKLAPRLARKPQSSAAIGYKEAEEATLQPSLSAAESEACAVSLLPEAASPETTGEKMQNIGRPKKKKWWSKDSRAEITGAELEAAILEAVKKTAACEDFVGVIVGRKISRSHRDPNWEVQGAKFGKSDRKLVEEALASIVPRLQKELVLAENTEATAKQSMRPSTAVHDDQK